MIDLFLLLGFWTREEKDNLQNSKVIFWIKIKVCKKKLIFFWNDGKIYQIFVQKTLHLRQIILPFFVHASPAFKKRIHLLHINFSFRKKFNYETFIRIVIEIFKIMYKNIDLSNYCTKK